MGWKTNSTVSNFQFLANVMKDKNGSDDTVPENLFSPPCSGG